MTSPAPARPHAAPAQLLRLLTPREAQALTLLATGRDTRAIAEELGIATGTARTHLHRAMRKLGVRTREEAVSLAALLSPVPVTHPAPVAQLTPVATVATVAAVAAVAAEPRPESFEQLCALTHTRLVQQTFLLTASRHRAVHAVRLALSAAGRRWREVSVLPDPEGWVREYAFAAAQAVWHRGGPRRAHAVRLPHRRIKVHPMPDRPQQPDQDQGRLTPRDRDLLKALKRLTRPQRRALVLHDALGLPVAQVAAEVQSSTAAATGRVLTARAGLARSVPTLAGPDPTDPDFGARLGALLHQAAVHGCPAPRQPSPLLLKVRGRVRSGLATTAAGTVTLAMAAAIVTTLTGNGPSNLFRPPALGPGQVCSTATNGSAGPAAPGADAGPGLRSHWCGPTPNPAADAPVPTPAPAPAARPVAEALRPPVRPAAPLLPPLPVAVPAAPCPALWLCPTTGPNVVDGLRVELPPSR